MPEQKTVERAQRAKRAGKAPTTQAGEFVREEIDHIREGKHGARNAKQAIAIGLSKARRAGIDLPPPKRTSAASPTAIARQTRSASRRRSASERSAAARKAVRTKGPAKRKAAARKGARTRA